MEEIKSTTHTRISWDSYFMNIADVVKTRSLDTKTQVGAVLVSLKDNRIISTGYNSVCAGMDDSLIDWTNRDYVHQIVIHAEMNAVLYAQSKFEDAILYSTLSPCKDCTRDIEYVKNLCNFFKIELIRFENET
jgi:dCMP deaminase